MVLKHLMWLIDISLFAIQMSFLVKVTSSGILGNALLTTGLLVLALTMAFLETRVDKSQGGPILFFMLLVVLYLKRVLSYSLKNSKLKNKWLYKGAGVTAFILLFMGFILYDTKKLQDKSQSL